MKRPALTIARLMGVIAIAALNIAAARALYLYDVEALVCVAPIGLILEVGLLRAIRSRGRVRIFWSGFVAAGLATIASLLWALARHDSWCYYVWETYAEFADNIIFMVKIPVIVLVPSLLISVVFGLIASSIIRRGSHAPAPDDVEFVPMRENRDAERR